MEPVTRALRLAAAFALSLASICAHQPPPTGVIEGDVVEAATGQGISGARVRLRAGTDDPLVATADDQGHFRFTGLKFTSYRVEASYPGFIVADEARRGRALSAGISLYRHPVAQVRVEMQRYGVISGRVTDSAGIPIEGIMVGALEPRSPGGPRHGCGPSYVDAGSEYLSRYCTNTNDLGEFRLAPLPAGTYYAMAQQLGPGFSGLVDPRTRPPADPRERGTFHPRSLKPAGAQPVVVAEGKQSRADVQVVSQGGVKISGRILNLPPGASAAVSLRALSTSSGHGPVSMVGDRFEFFDLLPGKYMLQAGIYVHDNESPQPLSAAATRTIDIGAQDVDGIDLTLAPTFELQGTVNFESGCPAAPVWIQLYADSAFQNVHAGLDGRFSVPHIVPGQYRASVRSELSGPVFLRSIRLADAEASTTGFELNSQTAGPLDLTVGCMPERSRP